MASKASLVKNGIFNSVKVLSSLIFPVITFAYAARILGDAGVGRVTFARSIISYFTMIAMLGMNYYGTREAAKLREDKDKLSKFSHQRGHDAAGLRTADCRRRICAQSAGIRRAAGSQQRRDCIAGNGHGMALSGCGRIPLHCAAFHSVSVYCACRAVSFCSGTGRRAGVFGRPSDGIIRVLSIEFHKCQKIHPFSALFPS